MFKSKTSLWVILFAGICGFSGFANADQNDRAPAFVIDSMDAAQE